MAIKRKFEIESEDAFPVAKRQLKLIPFPGVECDNDVAMSEAEPLYSDTHHLRLASDASSSSTTSTNSPVSESPCYPGFSTYPLPFFDDNGRVESNSHNYSHYATQPQIDRHIGLLQPSESFRHHGTGCSQIPKLRVACSSGLNGQRTMWSFCEQCGAISMVEND